MLKTWTAALLGVGAVALFLFILLWTGDGFDSPDVKRYESQSKALVFDFSTDQDRTQTTSVGMRLGPRELTGLDKAEVFVKLKETQIVRYPDTGGGSLECTTVVLINGKEFDREHISYDLRADGPAQWSGSHDEVETPYTDLTYPTRLDWADATKLFHPAQDNQIQATVTCTNRVDQTGPMWVLIDFAPLYAIITT